MTAELGGGPILDRDNIINVREGESLYRLCINLRRRLSGVPGFRQYIEEMEERENDGADPVSSLWQCFRSGTPLLAIYNASNPESGDLTINTNLPEKKWGKAAAALFIKSCMQQMHIASADTFTIMDLYSDNTTGFLKVIKLVDRVLDILRLSGKLDVATDSEPSREGTDSPASIAEKPKMTRRQYILRELVETERQYVHHLQNLQALKKELEEIGSLKGDAIHNMFLNLNNILDFAQRFLIRVEQQNELPEEQQNWGAMFVRYKDPFRQYEPFIANQKRCEATLQAEWSRMCETSKSPLAKKMLANPTILNGFLLKPFQRLTKYPLLLKDLEKVTDEQEKKDDLGSAVAVIQDVLMQADASIDKETRDEAVLDLQERIDDWKTLQIGAFGELLLLGSFMVAKEGNAVGMRSEDKEYHIYLFQRILIMCKDINPSKPKNSLKMGSKPTSSRNGKPKMSLKGRIYLINLTNITPQSSPGHYTLQISWRTETTSQDTFLVKFRNDEMLQRWHTALETQRSSSLFEQKQRATSDTHLQSLAGAKLENPYANQEDDDDYRASQWSDTTYVGGQSYSSFNMSRNASSTSLRSRSATGGSGERNPHLSQGHPRMPNGAGGLSLNTAVAGTPSDYGSSSSYFSPIDRDTPPQSASTRSSSQSAFAGYHRNHPSMNGPIMGYQQDSYRNTAPALARNAPNGNPYMQQQRGQPRPGMPTGTQSSQMTARMRSASSPDIHPNVQASRKYVSGDGVPNVPPIPSYAKQMAPPSRSQNNSPSGVNGPMPLRQNSQGYGVQPSSASRPPMSSHGYTYDQSYAQDPRRQQGHVSSHSTGRPLSPIQQGAQVDSSQEIPMPSQLKAKVCYESNYVSMIIPSNIQYRSLTDRIDAKLSRFTNDSIASGSVKLQYRDQDGDFIIIDDDDGVNEALLDWKEVNVVGNGGSAELVLYATATGEAGA
ncbi:Rho guanine nucleotide exchange factor scd1 [Cyphellophora attinorum]|uniref:Rho guanine nucleotide exchange factor scd1 n=1 Tax=Cyphellophora attinorum TaxID=1664694 RepID=A0A0N0NLL7_9EURO|nr:Rho guanine nucleotide exchange factor scd1 [Phialophora attinorum]KPI39179.1 Rho guanine nucleotide exchange factor scd1 [Phialophora attinorum]